MISNLIKTENKKIISKINKKFTENKSIFEQFIKNWYELLEIFFDEKEYWDSFYIEQKDEEKIFEIEKNKKAKLNLVFAFANKNSVFYFKVLYWRIKK